MLPEKPSKIGGNIPFSKGLIFKIFENIIAEQMKKLPGTGLQQQGQAQQQQLS